MDSDNFFGFDTSIPPEDALEGLEDEEYDALNDETFGSAAVDGDWEEGHEQMASLTEARRRNQKDYQNSLKQDDNGTLLENFQNLALLSYNSQNEHRLGQSSAPISIGEAYPSRNETRTRMGSLLGDDNDLPCSPSNSIWTPSPDLDKLQPVTRHSPSNGVSRSMGQLPGLSHLGALPSLGLQTVKTVDEIEEEMKLQQKRPSPAGQFNTLRAEELERELARLGAVRPQHHQSMMGSTVHPHHYNFQRQGSFTGSVPNNHAPFNRQFQRAFPNQGNFQGSLQQYPHQQVPQQFMNNFPNSNNAKGMMNHLSQPPPQHHHQHHPHPNHHHHMQGANHYGMYPHHNNIHGNHGHHQQSHHFLSDGRCNCNGYDQARNGKPHYDRRNIDRPPYEQNKMQHDRRNFDRYPYDQNRGQDQGKNHYDRSNNSRDDYPNHLGRTRRDSEAEWEEWHRLREEDEYCGLMTPKEKNWLKNIQAMQLQTDNPYQDDYYFVMYSVKQQRKREEEVISIDGLQLLLPDRGKDGGREYEPPRLENSLGKLQVVSVNAPRKIIDLQVVHPDPAHPTTPLQRDMRKHRFLLLHIEKLYNVMMEIDDLERKIRHLPDCPTRDLYRSKSRQLALKLWENITLTSEKLVQLLSVRKGKSLLFRLLMWLDETAHTKLVLTLFQNMLLLTKRDVHDQYLALFWPLTDRLIASSNHNLLLEIAKALLAQGGATQKANISSALYSKYGVSLILAMMVRGEQLSSDIEKYDVWQDLLAAVIGILSSPSDSFSSKPLSDSGKSSSDFAQALPSVALAASPFPPAVHLARCNRVDPQSIKASQEKMKLLEMVHTKSTTQKPAMS
ncbi:hypothetical protein SK128_006936 [Halocaridina rubra]|uniref:Uncharacterized protein n=1 Tax=Halocaridina rubra TaxID=373956 RepID=A0AAN8WHJ4_HALRR